MFVLRKWMSTFGKWSLSVVEANAYKTVMISEQLSLEKTASSVKYEHFYHSFNTSNTVYLATLLSSEASECQGYGGTFKGE